MIITKGYSSRSERRKKSLTKAMLSKQKASNSNEKLIFFMENGMNILMDFLE
jgi:hypothetical protein